VTQSTAAAMVAAAVTLLSSESVRMIGSVGEINARIRR